MLLQLWNAIYEVIMCIHSEKCEKNLMCSCFAGDDVIETESVIMTHALEMSTQTSDIVEDQR